MMSCLTILTYFFYSLCGLSFLIEGVLLIYIYYLHQNFDKKINEILIVLEKWKKTKKNKKPIKKMNNNSKPL